MKGVTLLAIGKPEYGYWAVNMAVSIKAHNPNLKVQLVYEDSAIARCKNRIGIFDYTTQIKHKHAYIDGKFEPGFCKLNLYKYFKFSETIYLDVDGIVIDNLDSLFEICNNKPYASQVIGHGSLSKKTFGDNMYWAEPETLIDHYGLSTQDVLPFINQSFAYIEKGPTAAKIYNTALALFKNPVPLNKLKNRWGKSGQPDELYMNISLMQNNIDASIPCTPVYFCKKGWGGSPELNAIKKKHFVIGYFGDGHSNERKIVKLYDKLMGKHYKEILATDHIFRIHYMLVNKFVNS